jgi:hypothetical protein
MRREPRRQVMCRIEITWEDEAGGLRNQQAMLEDKSVSGAGISARKAIPAGTRINLRERDQERAGVVRYCRPDEIGYLIGIQFDKSDKGGESAEIVTG